MSTDFCPTDEEFAAEDARLDALIERIRSVRSALAGDMAFAKASR